MKSPNSTGKQIFERTEPKMKKVFTRNPHRESGGALKEKQVVIAEAASPSVRGENEKGFIEGKTPISEEIRVFRRFPRILEKI
ncbi:MAG: hypothetical protein IJK35_02480 [Oscillospiraceae bacterium]|nr:hypothetical protein [Oscillospiraceae bacterium]